MNLDLLKYQLKEACSQPLPGESSHRKMIPTGRKLAAAPEDYHHIKKSSVLVLIFAEDNELYTCLIKRPLTMRQHPGQIAFPGGQIDKGDMNAAATASREAKEEIGINPDRIEIIGSLSNLFVEVSQFNIHPIIGWSDTEPIFCINQDEVEELIFFPLIKYLKINSISETEIETSSGKFIIPYFPFENRIIWGATAMILSELIDVLRSIKIIREIFKIDPSL